MSKWTQEDINWLKEHYPTEPTAWMAAKLNRTASSIRNKASALGLTKTPEFIRKMNRENLNQEAGKASQFAKGNTPRDRRETNPKRHNPGQLRHSERSTMAARNNTPVGTTAVRNGILFRKENDTKGRFEDRWIAVHCTVWEAAHGAIPHGMVVTFKPGKHSTDEVQITPDNLELVTRSDLMRGNTIEQYPRELRRALLAASRLRQATLDRGRSNENQR